MRLMRGTAIVSQFTVEELVRLKREAIDQIAFLRGRISIWENDVIEYGTELARRKAEEAAKATTTTAAAATLPEPQQ